MILLVANFGSSFLRFAINFEILGFISGVKNFIAQIRHFQRICYSSVWKFELFGQFETELDLWYIIGYHYWGRTTILHARLAFHIFKGANQSLLIISTFWRNSHDRFTTKWSCEFTTMHISIVWLHIDFIDFKNLWLLFWIKLQYVLYFSIRWGCWLLFDLFNSNLPQITWILGIHCIYTVTIHP